MSVRELGDSGLAVSRTGLGGNNFGPVVDLAGTRSIVDAAIDAGVTFFDTAERYGDGDSERSWARLSEAGAIASCSPPSSAADRRASRPAARRNTSVARSKAR